MSLGRLAAGTCVGLALVTVYAAVLTLTVTILRRPTANKNRRGPGGKLLVMARVNSINWCRSHILPLADSALLRELIALVDGPMIEHPKVRRVFPPTWLARGLPPALARSIWLFRVTMAERPDVIMAYSFFPAGLLGLLAARLGGARIVYQVTGGPVELEGGGVSREHRFLLIPVWISKILRPLALRICSQFDLIIGRGETTRAFLRNQAGCERVEIVPGSVDARRFVSVEDGRSCDVIFVGRLVAVKQPDHILQITQRLVRSHANLRVAIVGDGPLRDSLQKKAREMNLLGHVTFFGQSEEIEELLLRSKVFLLPSRSEGLSIALAEAMMAGAVPVVSDVGDLAELVQNGQTGWRVERDDVNGFAERVSLLLSDSGVWKRISLAARSRALANNSLEVITRKWTDCLGSLAGQST